MLDETIPSPKTRSPIPKLLIGVLAILVVLAIAKLVANMYGPHFLLLYGAAIAIILLVSAWVVQDPTIKLPLPLIPAEPDPYKIAYLRSQETGVAKVAVMDLIQHGYLQITEDFIKQAENHGDVSALTLMQREVFDWFSSVSTTSAASGSLLARHIQPRCAVYQQQLQNEQLLNSDRVKAGRQGISWIGTLIIIGLGGFKLVVASLRGHHNIGFLVLMGIFSVSLLWSICHTPRLSNLGINYLNQLEATFAQLKQKIKADIPEETFAQLKQKIETGIPSAFEYNLVVALYGFEVLAGTRYDRYYNLFLPAINTASWVSTNSGGDSCSGGCSSSSCGSGCGGGGCGGCGG